MTWNLFYRTGYIYFFTYLLLHVLGVTRGTISVVAEEMQDSKFDVTMQLSAVKLDKKDFFGKVVYTLHCILCLLYYVLIFTYLVKRNTCALYLCNCLANANVDVFFVLSLDSLTHS